MNLTEKEINIVEQAKKYIRLVITDKCNLNCYYCHKEGIKWDDSERYSIEGILSKLYEQKADGIKKLKVTGGEPFLYPQIFELLSESNKFIEEVGVTTNGTLIPLLKDKIEKLSRDIRFNITLNTLIPEEYEHITGKNEIKKVIDGINIIHQFGFPLKINMIIRKSTIHEIPQMITFIKNKNITLKLMDLVDSKSHEFVSKQDIFDYLSNKYSLNPKLYSEVHNKLDISGSTIQLPLRVYLTNCYDCPIFPCSEGILSKRMSLQGKLLLCFRRALT